MASIPFRSETQPLSPLAVVVTEPGMALRYHQAMAECGCRARHEACGPSLPVGHVTHQTSAY